ncbi:MAG: divergent PAP2 family protein [Dehalococcoidales bacterium]|nr:divergent PAP2 family protein [Dehalococcoidales bacterium]
MLDEILTNKVLVVPLCAWVAVQLLKGFIELLKERRFDLGFFITSGGMPSSHSAMVSALATAVLLTAGPDSAAFAVSVILAMVVMYDAAGVRWAVSQQASILNRIVRELRLRRPRGEVERDLRELIGHTPFQVIVGSALGILIAWLCLGIGSV